MTFGPQHRDEFTRKIFVDGKFSRRLEISPMREFSKNSANRFFA
jgi:hypothetical protein